MIKNYFEFINESLIAKDEVNFFCIGENLRNILESIQTTNENVLKICKSFLALDNRVINTVISYIDITDSKEYLKCLKSKDILDKTMDFSSYEFIDKHEDKFFDIRIGRLAKQVVELYNDVVFKLSKGDEDYIKKYEIIASNTDLEQFVNEFKAKYDYIKLNIKSRIKVVQGEDIRFYYDKDNYSKKTGSLSNSCMRYKECQDFFSLYEDNKNISLAVMLDDENKLLGRALLFKLVNGYTFMDRVYTSNSSDHIVFTEWAKENKFLYKEKQDSSALSKIISPVSNYIKGVPMNLEVIVNKLDIKYKRFYSFPYLDTLKYLYWDKGILTNTRNPEYGYYVLLEDGDGNALCSYCNSTGSIKCVECDDFSGCDNCDEGNVVCPRCGGFTIISI
jgi:hypothetical protein